MIPADAGINQAGRTSKGATTEIPDPVSECAACPGRQFVQDIVVKQVQRLAERYALRPERRDGDGGNQQDGGESQPGRVGQSHEQLLVLAISI